MAKRTRFKNQALKAIKDSVNGKKIPKPTPKPKRSRKRKANA